MARQSSYDRHPYISRGSAEECVLGWQSMAQQFEMTKVVCVERTGLHEREFIDTRRHWFTGNVPHDTHGGVNVSNLVQAREAVVESAAHAFVPFVVHYAETFIVPSTVGKCTVGSKGAALGTECATVKAFVHTEACT